MNVLIPMAGLGKRLGIEKYGTIKPLIMINGAPIIEHTIRSLKIDGNFIFVLLKNKFSSELKEKLQLIVQDSKIIEVENLNNGPAESCLAARKYINNDDELLIANSDQVMFWNSENFLLEAREREISGSVVTYISNSLKNSYAKVDKSGYVKEIQEKKLISNFALVGVHYFRRGRDFVKSALKMINENNRSSGEFYVGPSYNYIIREGGLIKSYMIEGGQHYPIGTPEDLEIYKENFGNL